MSIQHNFKFNFI